MSVLKTGAVVASLALSSTFAERRRSLLLVALLALVSAVAVLGGVFVDSIEAEMRRTMVESLTGELHIAPASSVDKIALFGDVYFGDTTLERIEAAGRLAERLRGAPGVLEAVPMATRLSVIVQPHPIDDAIDRLRRACESDDDEAAERASGHLRWAAAGVLRGLDESGAGLAAEERERRRKIAAQVHTDQLRSQVENDPVRWFTFLDTQFAPLFGESTPLFQQLTGVDMSAFRRAFPRFEMVDGVAPSDDDQAFIVPHDALRELRHPYVTRLARLRERASYDPEVPTAAQLTEVQQAAPHLIDRLSPEQGETLRARLCESIECAAADTLYSVLVRFAEVDRSSIAARLSYLEDTALVGLPQGLLTVGERYIVAMSDEGGQLRSRSLLLSGTFRFRGLGEDLVLLGGVTNASTFALLDDERRAAATPAESSVANDVDAEAWEAELFGQDHAAPDVVTTGAFDEFDGAAPRAPPGDEPRFLLADWPAQSIALRAAPGPDVVAGVTALLHEHPSLTVTDGLAVAGPIGQALPIIRGIVSLLVWLILLLGLGVLANALVIAWLRRVRELGTLRALGASRAAVLTMLLMEALALSLVGALIGVALALGVTFTLGEVGVPAPDPIFEFIFGGPALHPTVSGTALLLAPAVVLLALLAALYPAWRATRASPREVMEMTP